MTNRIISRKESKEFCPKRINMSSFVIAIFPLDPFLSLMKEKKSGFGISELVVSCISSEKLESVSPSFLKFRFRFINLNDKLLFEPLEAKN